MPRPSCGAVKNREGKVKECSIVESETMLKTVSKVLLPARVMIFENKDLLITVRTLQGFGKFLF